MDPHGKPVAGAGPAGVVLHLSLFLLLLAFFILLNAISFRESRRARDVLGSIDQAFTIDPRLVFGGQPVTARSGSLIAVEALKTLGDLFETAVAATKITHLAPGRSLAVSVPADRLFGPTGAVLPEYAGVFDRVADSLRRPPSGFRTDLDLRLVDDGAAMSVGAPATLAARAGALIQALLVRGVPAAALSAGVGPGESGMVRLLFTVRPLDDGRGEGGG